MTLPNLLRHSTPFVALTVLSVVAATSSQQTSQPARDTLPDGPRIFDSSRRGPSGGLIRGPHFRVVPMKGLTHPSGGVLSKERLV